jgi:hypothetical protein
MATLLLSFGLILTDCPTEVPDPGPVGEIYKLLGTWVNTKGDKWVFEDEGEHIDIMASPYYSGSSYSSGVWGVESYDGTILIFQGHHTPLCTARVASNVLAISDLTDNLSSFNGEFIKEGTGGNGGKNLPAVLGNVDAAGAKKAFTDVFAKLDAGQKEEFENFLMGIVMNNEDLATILMNEYPDMESIPDDPSGLPEKFWEAVAKYWSGIQKALQAFVDEVNNPSDPGGGGSRDSKLVGKWLDEESYRGYEFKEDGKLFQLTGTNSSEMKFTWTTATDTITLLLDGVVGERCCLPNNSLKKPKANNESYNDFVHTIVFGKTNTLSHQPGTPRPQ